MWRHISRGDGRFCRSGLWLTPVECSRTVFPGTRQFDTGPFSNENLEKFLDFYVGSKIVITTPKNAVPFPEGTSVNNGYAFFIPLSHSPQLRLGHRNITVEKNRLLASNPGQKHGSAAGCPAVRFIGMQIDKDFVDETARQVYGKQGVCFQGESVKFCPELQNLISSFIEEARNRPAGYRFMIDSLSAQIVIKLLR